LGLSDSESGRNAVLIHAVPGQCADRVNVSVCEFCATVPLALGIAAFRVPILHVVLARPEK
jgi:hypothetical protein